MLNIGTKEEAIYRQLNIVHRSVAIEVYEYSPNPKELLDIFLFIDAPPDKVYLIQTTCSTIIWITPCLCVTLIYFTLVN